MIQGINDHQKFEWEHNKIDKEGLQHGGDSRIALGIYMIYLQGCNSQLENCVLITLINSQG